MQPTLEQDFTGCGEVLAVSLELSKNSWKVALHDGRRQQPAMHTAKEEGASARLSEAVGLIEETKGKWKLGEATRVVVIYEAGQDGFWIWRALSARGYEVVVVDAASIPVERQARRAKTDRLDAIRLVTSLLGWLRGERDRLHALRVPSEQAEAQRHCSRERGQLQKEIGQHRDRMRKLLRTVGCWDDVKGDFAGRLKSGQVRCHDDSALPEVLRERLAQECERLALAQAQLKRVEEALVKQLPAPVQQRVTQLSQLKGVGWVGAVRLVLELFWRDFDNRRQVGACVGLVPQPYDSGQSRVDQGISKQGNRRVRALLIEMAWLWLRYQPESALSKWFARRTGEGVPNKRGRRIAIVAVARRLAIALWRYLKDGEIPAGAALKAA
jgi:transposase